MFRNPLATLISIGLLPPENFFWIWISGSALWEDLPEAIAGINGNLFNTSSADLKLSHSLFLKIHIKHQNLIHTIVITDNSNTPFLVRSRFLGHWNDAKILNLITAISKNQEQSFANVFVTAFTRVKKYIDVLHISRYRELFQNSLTYNIILTWS